MGAFSRVRSVAWSLQGVYLRIIWRRNGSRFCGSDPWILVPEEVQVPSSLSVRGCPVIGLTGKNRHMPSILFLFKGAVGRICPGAKLTIL